MAPTEVRGQVAVACTLGRHDDGWNASQWVLTLPVGVPLGAGIFSFALYLLFHLLGLR